MVRNRLTDGENVLDRYIERHADIERRMYKISAISVLLVGARLEFIAAPR